jgi:hypothetical protein
VEKVARDLVCPSGKRGWRLRASATTATAKKENLRMGAGEETGCGGLL